MQATHRMNNALPSGPITMLEPEVLAFIAALQLDDDVVNEVIGMLALHPAREHLALLRIWFADDPANSDEWDE